MIPRVAHPRWNFPATLVAALYISLAFSASDTSAGKFDVLDYVDPLIGTANGGAHRIRQTRQSEMKLIKTHLGHVFAGATLPFGKNHSIPQHDEVDRIDKAIGMAKAVADTVGENQAGFAEDTTDVTGFSHMHDSGTGGVCDVQYPGQA